MVVVGTGAGGAPLLAELAAAGLHVVALEAGPVFRPDTFTPDEATAAELYWRDERLSAGENPQAFGGNNSGTGVGGSMLHYGAFMPRMDARDFHLFNETGQGCDWPFGAAELEPWVVQVEETIGVSGPATYPWDPERRYAYAPAARNAPAEIMVRAASAIGLTCTDAPAAVITQTREQPHYGRRLGCVGCGACHQGCRNDAKSGPVNTWLPLARAAGADIRSGCMVNGLERDGTGRISAVLYREQGVDRRLPCRAVVLSAGAVETPRLLLHTGLANGSGQVGRNYMTHVATQVWGSFDEEIRPNRGYPSAIISEDMMRPADADFAGGYLIQSLGMMPATWANLVARSRGLWGESLVRALRRYNFSAGVGINGEGLPSESNRVELSCEADASGMPKPRIFHNNGPNERAMHDHAARLLTRLWAAAGAHDIWVAERAAHMIGTCRMGTDPRNAVVDPFGRSFDIDNLWICDHSVFPSAAAANPALTIMALSLRTARALRLTL